jgi:hypothetical protein
MLEVANTRTKFMRGTLSVSAFRIRSSSGNVYFEKTVSTISYFLGVTCSPRN